MSVIQSDIVRPRQGQRAQVTQSENPMCSSNLCNFRFSLPPSVLMHTLGMSATHLGLATFV